MGCGCASRQVIRSHASRSPFTGGAAPNQVRSATFVARSPQAAPVVAANNGTQPPLLGGYINKL